ncbi:RfaG Glycosyltransferase [actinobacterium SCGC AAA044-D11]
MKVWILQTGEPLQIDSDGFRPMRAMNLADQLTSKGHEVVLWSSDFNHFTKKHRFGREETIQVSNLLKIKLIPSRGYLSHNGFARLVDHAQLGFNLSRMLRRENTRPDVAFLGYPPIEPAWALTNWLKRHHIPAILDVKDAWPDVLVNHFPRSVQNFAKLGLFPYFLMMKSIFKKVTGFSSVTQEFLDWCLVKSGREQTQNDFVVPLTSQDVDTTEEEILKEEFWWDEFGITNDGKLRGYFVGSISSAFNFDPIISTARKYPSVEFVIAGDGPNLKELIDQTKEIPNIFWPGWINTKQALVLASRSSFALAPLRPRTDFEMSIPNKFYDAMKYGKPIFTSLKGPASKIVLDSGSGKIYGDGVSNSLEVLISDLILDSSKLEAMSKNSRLVYENYFNFEKVYSGLVHKIEKIARGNQTH